MAVDPRDIENLFADEAYSPGNPQTKKTYLRHWVDFVEMSGIEAGKEPTFENFMEFFAQKREKLNCTGNTLLNVYSSINKVYQKLYDRRLQVRN